jgi:beclin 1
VFKFWQSTFSVCEFSAQEKELRERLAKVRSDRAAVQHELATLADQEAELETYYQSFWNDFLDVEFNMQTTRAEINSANRRIKHQQVLLDQLRRTSVLSDAFHISHDGHFGTINGFRIGRLDNTNVPVEEFNAGLGQVALLLEVLSTEMKCPLKVRLMPCGSFSKLIRDTATGRETLDLFEKKQTSFVNFFSQNPLDAALGCLLDCIEDLSQFARRVDNSFVPPFTIERKERKIGQFVIKCTTNTAEEKVVMQHAPSLICLESRRSMI